MKFENLASFLHFATKSLGKGPLGVVLCEDEIEVDSTIQHTLDCGFKKVIVVGDVPVGKFDDPRLITVDHGVTGQKEACDVMNQIIPLAAGQWMFYCFNSEFLFYPFSDSRSIGELLTFCAEERRDSVLTFTIDLYAQDLGRNPNGINRDSAFFDRSGYFATGRQDEWGNSLERQLDFHGGLRSRFEEFVPAARRKIDRVSIFRAKEGLKLRPDHTFSDEEYNTYACPWHNSPTASITSFRTAKALKRNPSSTFEIPSFHWHGSAPFEWKAQQLMEAGLMEPGQWF